MGVSSGPMTPLNGLVVVDLSRHLPGPLLTRMLKDLGADVVKVEPPTGDPARFMPPMHGDAGALYTSVNAGKRGLALNLKQETARQILMDIVKKADVLVETFRPGVMERLGLSPSTLFELNPRLILCSVTGFGQDNSHRDRPGHDLNFTGRAGALNLTGPADREPVTAGIQVGDIAGGSMMGLSSVLAALMEREQTGQGRHLDISMTRGCLTFGHYGYLANGANLMGDSRGATPLGGGAPCYRVYETSDGRFMTLGALEPKFFVAFCEAAGCAHLSSKGLEMGPGAKQVMDELETVFRAKTQTEWVEVLEGVDCCCEPVLTHAEAIKDEVVAAEIYEIEGVACMNSHFGAPVAPAWTDRPDALKDGRAVLESFGISEELTDQAVQEGSLILSAESSS
jgi:alpha-methylacyl-CoA racemase